DDARSDQKGHGERNNDLAISGLGFAQRADFRCDYEVLRLGRRIAGDGTDSNQQQKDSTSDTESVDGDPKEVEQRCAGEKKQEHQPQHRDRNEKCQPTLDAGASASGITNEDRKHSEWIEERKQGGGKRA